MNGAEDDTESGSSETHGLPGLDDHGDLDAGPPSPIALELDLDALRPVARAPLHAPDLPSPPPPYRPSTPREPAPRPVPDHGPLPSERAAIDAPLPTLLTLPLSFLLAGLAIATDFGRLLATPFAIQFHEFGHALVAWLTGRVALPMPCGLTVWSLEPSIGIHVVLVLLALLLGLRGLRERARFPVILAVGLVSAQLVVAAFVRDDEAVILLAGGAAELVLPALAMIASFFRMPDRLRWDFFRFLVVPIAASTYLLAMRMWLAVRLGREPAPVGSFLGTSGDGSGDLERLVRDHGFTIRGIVDGYLALGIVTGAALLVVFAVAASRAVVRLRR